MNPQHFGIAASLTVHAGLLIAFLAIPAMQRIIPQVQTIQVTLTDPASITGSHFLPVSGANRYKEKQLTQVITPEMSVPLHSRNQETTSPAPPAVENISQPLKGDSPYNSADVVISQNKSGAIAKTGGQDTPIAAKASDSVKEAAGIAKTAFGSTGAPSFRYRELPVYPPMAKRLGKEGRVVLQLLIDASGRLQNIEVVEQAGFGFTEAAIDAVKRSTYVPAVRNGEKIASKALLPVRFQLQ